MADEVYRRQWIRSTFPHAEHHFGPMGLDGNGNLVGLHERDGDGKLLSVEKLPGITIPKSSYMAHERDAGKRTYVEVTPMQLRRLELDDVYLSLRKTGMVQVVDEIPGQDKTQSDLLHEAHAELDLLRKKVAAADSDTSTTQAVKDQLAAQLSLAQEAMDSKDEALAAADRTIEERNAQIAELKDQIRALQRPADEQSTRAELMKVGYKDLQKMAAAKGVSDVNQAKAKLVDLILQASGYGPPQR